MNKNVNNIIYFTLGGNPYYSLLLELCLISLFLTKNINRIIILADQKLINILNNSKLNKFIQYELKPVNSNDVYQSSLNKFMIPNSFIGCREIQFAQNTPCAPSFFLE